jgi:hypothetical protein
MLPGVRLRPRARERDRYPQGHVRLWHVVTRDKFESRGPPFGVLADHCQFYLADLEAHARWIRSHGTDPDLALAGWTTEAVYVHRIGVEPHSLPAGTAREDTMETTLCAHPAEPRAGMEDAEHVVEADIDLPNGDVVIYGIGDDPGRVPHISVAKAATGARVLHPVCAVGRRSPWHRVGTATTSTTPRPAARC